MLMVEMSISSVNSRVFIYGVAEVVFCLEVIWKFQKNINNSRCNLTKSVVFGFINGLATYCSDFLDNSSGFCANNPCILTL